MVKSSEKSFDEVILQEALEYIAKVEELKGLEEEYKKTYEERYVIGNKIITLGEDLLRLQGSFNYYLKNMANKYGFKKINLVGSLFSFLSIIEEAANKDMYFVKYGVKSLYYNDSNEVKTITLVGDMSVLCLYPESFYTKEQIKEIIANLMNGDKSIVIGTIYDAELIKGFNKFNLNVGATDGRMLYALIKDDELGEVINNLEIYLNNNNRHIEDIPRPIIVENIKPNKFIRTREI